MTTPHVPSVLASIDAILDPELTAAERTAALRLHNSIYGRWPLRLDVNHSADQIPHHRGEGMEDGLTREEGPGRAAA